MANLVVFNSTNYNYTTGTYIFQSTSSTATQDDPSWTGTNLCVRCGGLGDTAGGTRFASAKNVDFGDGLDYSILNETRVRFQFRWNQGGGVTYPDYLFIRFFNALWNTSVTSQYIPKSAIVIKPNTYSGLKDASGSVQWRTTCGLGATGPTGYLVSSDTSFSITSDTWYKVFVTITQAGDNRVATASITSDDEQTGVASITGVTIATSPSDYAWAVGNQQLSNGSRTSIIDLDNLLIKKDS